MKENNVHLISRLSIDMSNCKVDKYSFTLVINHLKKRIDGHIILPIRIDLS